MLFNRLQNLLISMKICIVVTAIVMKLLVPEESVLELVVITLFMT